MRGGLATLPFGLGALGHEAYRYLVFAGLLGVLGHVLSNEAVKRSDISVLGTFDYTASIWAWPLMLWFLALYQTGLACLVSLSLPLQLCPLR